MKKSLLYSAVVLSLTFLGLTEARAEAGKKAFGDQVGLFLMARPALNIGFDNNSGTDTYFSFQGGLSGAYFLTQHIGIELSTDIIQRGFEGSGFGGKIFAVDIGAGPSFAWAGFLGDSGRSQFHLGGFYSIPFSDFEKNVFKAEKFFGLQLKGDTLFAINEQFSLGFGSYGKFGLMKGVSSPLGSLNGDKFFEIGFGLSASFQPMVQYAD